VGEWQMRAASWASGVGGGASGAAGERDAAAAVDELGGPVMGLTALLFFCFFLFD